MIRAGCSLRLPPAGDHWVKGPVEGRGGERGEVWRLFSEIFETSLVMEQIRAGYAPICGVCEGVFGRAKL